MNNQVYENLMNPTTEFLDKTCEVGRLSNSWIIFIIPDLDDQVWAYQNGHEINRLFNVDDCKKFMKERGLERTNSDTFVTTVRSLVGAKVKIVMPTNVDVDCWLNVVIPSTNPIEMNDVRVEAYVDHKAALIDAEDERIGDCTVFTVKQSVSLDLVNTKQDDNPLVIGNTEGRVHPTDIVEMILDENTYLRKMLRGMLKLIPANNVVEYFEALDPPFKKSVTDDSIEEIEELFREYGERLEKLLDLVKDARPPIDWNEEDKGVWENKLDNMVEYLNAATPKKHGQTLTVAEIRNILD